MATVGSVIKSPEISGLVPTLLKELCHPNEHTKYSFNILLQVRLLIMFSVVVSLAKQWAFEEPYVETITSENVLTWPHVVGKSLLIKSLVKHYTKHNLPDVRGLITIISGKQRQV